MKNWIVTLFLVLPIIAMGNVEITKMDFNKDSKRGILSISYNGTLKDYPELVVTGKSIQVLIPNSKVKSSIDRTVSFSSKLNDTQLKAYQATGTSAKIKALLPFFIQKHKDKVALTIKDNKIELAFPRVQVKPQVAKKVEKVAKKVEVKANVKKEFLDEKYLNNLLTIKSPEKKKEMTAKVNVKKQNNDEVSIKQAAAIPLAKKKSEFSFLEYGGKFVAFLGLMLLMFYGITILMKKGFIKKGKLGFLNNADQISVVSQTYIAPKKSLMLIKAHNQVFLVSNTDQGIHPISEIKDAAGLFKEGEKALSGMNFDTNLESADEDDTLEGKIKIKENIRESNKESSLSSYMDVKTKVSFSDQLKKKVKNLKPLQ